MGQCIAELRASAGTLRAPLSANVKRAILVVLIALALNGVLPR
jgi:hypothetical protein